jgi:tRNA U54 and U55 pseudouridine synthase Pus10
MAKTSWQVKKKYNEKTYDRVVVVIKKTAMPQIKQHVESKGETMSGYIKKLISADMGGIDL